MQDILLYKYRFRRSDKRHCTGIQRKSLPFRAFQERPADPAVQDLFATGETFYIIKAVAGVYPQGCTPVLDVLYSNINYMKRLMTLYNIASPSGKEKPILRYLKAEMKRMGIACRQDRLGNL